MTPIIGVFMSNAPRVIGMINSPNIGTMTNRIKRNVLLIFRNQFILFITLWLTVGGYGACRICANIILNLYHIIFTIFFLNMP